MRFWDSSAVVALLVAESESFRIEALLAEDPAVIAWWTTPVECQSALARRERAGEMTADEVARGTAKADKLWSRCAEVPPSERVRELAKRLVRVHELRAGNALQLAGASVAGGDRAEPLPFVTLDTRLALAARREGFAVLP
ncbi:MAG: type II toxin-antitoxin system VapC family toxin [Actinobacteria bacterium]|nr:type II toxin-antitoxin system VapC family toxin [Actinomycetota bacterium]